MDTDFEDSKRELVIDYCKAKYGDDCISRIGTIGKLAAKGIIRSIQRCEDKEIALANKICKTIPNKPGTTLKSALEESPELKEMYESDKEVTHVIDEAMTLEGLAKTVGQHACFDKDTYVLTNDGYKKIIDVKVGDEVLTHNNKFMPVVDTIVTNTDEVYTIKTGNGLPIEVTPNHPMLVKESKTSNPIWKKVEDLKETNYIGVAINTNSIVPTGTLPYNNPSFWWLIGRYLGDGWYELPKSRNEQRNIICVEKGKGQDIENHLKDCNFGYYMVNARTTDKYVLHKNEELNNFVKKLGKGASNKRLSNEILDLPKNLLESFIEGYLSADGYFEPKGQRLSFKTVSKELAIGMIQCINKVYNKHCGVNIISSTTDVIENRIVNSKEKYSCTFATDVRLKERNFFDGNYIWARITSISKESVIKEMFNLTVLNDSSYTANGLIAHNCGIIVAPSAVSNYIPQQMLKNKNNGKLEPTTQFTCGECEDSGLLKMDFLGLRTLGVLRESVDDINKLEPDKKLTLDGIDIFDKDVYKFIAEGNTDGVFQFESPFMHKNAMEVLQDIDTNKELTGRRCFDRMADATALGRPGPMAEIPNYVAAIIDKSKIKITNTPLDDIVTPTNGIIIYQEQVMHAVKALAGFSAGQADTVRKVMGKKLLDKLAELREWFIHGNAEKGISGCIKNGYTEAFAEDLWNRMAEFGKYAFNKSHSVAYTYLSAKTAWLSYYYPSIFMKATLNSFIDNNDKIKKYIATCKEKGIKVLSPDVNKSFEDFSVDYSTGEDPKKAPIRFGLKGIKSLGTKSTLVIAEREANGEFTSFQDFVKRMIGIPKFDKSAIESLILAGALDGFEGTRQGKLEVLEDLEKLYKPEAVLKRNGQMTILELANILDENEFLESIEEINEVVVDTKNEYDTFYKLDKEKEYTGFYITAHPVDSYKELFVKEKAIDIIELIGNEEESEEIIDDDNLDATVIEEKEDDLVDQTVKVGGIIKDVEVRYTKKDSSKMKTFVIEDDTESIKCVLFPKKLAEGKNDDLTEDKQIVLLTGKLVEDESFGRQILVEEIKSINTLISKTKTYTLTLDKNNLKSTFNMIKNCCTDDGEITVECICEGGRRTLHCDNLISTQEKLINIVGEHNFVTN